MKNKRKTLHEAQSNTIKKLIIKEKLNQEDYYALLLLYKSLVCARARSGRVGKYKVIEFRLGESPIQGLLNIIRNNAAFWWAWKILCEDYESSGLKKELRPEIHRLDSHYDLENIAAVSRENHIKKHALERSINTFLFAIGDNGGIHLGSYESKKQAKKSIQIGDDKLGKMINGDFDYVNNQGVSMIFLRLVPTDDPAPVITVQQQEDFNKRSYEYLQVLKKWQEHEPNEHRAKAIKDLSRALAHYESKLQVMDSLMGT